VKERKKNAAELRIEPASRDWQADTLTTQPPHLGSVENNASRTKPGSLKGCNESSRRTFAAALTEVPSRLRQSSTEEYSKS